MTKENLFEDMTAEEMRQRLQEVSEYMDELIKRRRCLCKLAGDDVREDAQWNLAHDVLEIIHCPEVDKPSPIGNLVIKIEVDTSELDEAIGKAERLAEMLNKNVLVGESDKGGGDDKGRGGRQVSEITGPTRDLLVDLLTPLANLSQP